MTRKQKEFKAGPHSVMYPAGYATFEDYVETMRVNLRILSEAVSPNYKMIKRYRADIKKAEQALKHRKAPR